MTRIVFWGGPLCGDIHRVDDPKPTLEFGRGGLIHGYAKAELVEAATFRSEALIRYRYTGVREP